MSSESDDVPPGWYPAPQGGQRYWDGKRWLALPEPDDATPFPGEATGPAKKGSNPFTPETFATVASLSAAVIYGVLFLGYRRYFHELGINPEDVGIGSTFVLARSVGFIALAIGAIALVGSIVNVLDRIEKKNRAYVLANGISNRKWPQWLRDQWQYKWWYLLLAAIAAVLLVYLLELRPPSWPIVFIALGWVVLLLVAGVVEHFAGRQSDPGVGFVIAASLSVVIAVLLPAISVYFRAHDLADSALRGSPPDFSSVQPYSILNSSIPVLDVSSDVVDMEWICTEKNKKQPSVFDGRDTSRGELLGESATSLFVRIDPPGKAAIVKLPAECVVIARYEDTPAAK